MPASEATQPAQMEAPAYVTIPILFLTDRDQKAESYGTKRRYPSQCLHSMYYGTATVTVPNHKKLLIDDRLSGLGWQAADHHEHKSAPEDRVQSADADLAKKEFIERIKTTLDKQNSPQLGLFVHGAADAFEDCPGGCRQPRLLFAKTDGFVFLALRPTGQRLFYRRHQYRMVAATL